MKNKYAKLVGYYSVIDKIRAGEYKNARLQHRDKKAELLHQLAKKQETGAKK